MEKCPVDSQCKVPEKVDKLSIDQEEIKETLEDYSKIQDKMYKKIGDMSECLSKIDQTIHGNAEIGFFDGLFKNQKKNNEDIEAIKKLMWFPKLVDDFWENVKKPLYWILFCILLSIVMALLSLNLGIDFSK